MAKEIRNSFFSETVKTIGILITIVSTSILIYSRIDSLEDRLIRHEEAEAKAYEREMQHYKNISDSLSVVSQKVNKAEGQIIIQREVIREDPEMASKLDRLTKVFEQISNDYEKKNNMTQLMFPNAN